MTMKKKSLRSKLTRLAKGGPRGNSALWRILFMVFTLSLLIPNLFHFATYHSVRGRRKLGGDSGGGGGRILTEGEMNKRTFQVCRL